jgi:pimeloyl-ACP methyl ester carboxylesterase
MTPEELSAALLINNCASVPYIDPMNPDRPLVLDCYRPDTHTPDKPVVLVLHGKLRDGTRLRHRWMPAADRHGLLFVAITFPIESWPGLTIFSEGYVYDTEGTVRPRQNWALAVPARVFALLRAAGLCTRDKAHLWGYSAGAQFVHRLMATQPHDIFAAVGVASAGWYTMPTLDRLYPDGLGGIGLSDEDIVKYLGYPMEVFVGDQDTDRDNLGKSGMAKMQGPHRLARGMKYVEIGREEAAKRGVPCRWKFIAAPDISHMGRFMSVFTASYWFDGQGAASL